jgi:S-adenosylmethionine/arginine decarboxylase-like enzyme
MRRMADPVSQKTAAPLTQTTSDRRKEQDLIEKILLEEVKQLQAQVISITYCFSRDLPGTILFFFSFCVSNH